MHSLILPRFLKADSGIAINATEEAGVIHADVLANDTSASPSLGRILSVGHFQSEGILYVSIVDTFAVTDTVSG